MPSSERKELNFASKSLPHLGSAMVGESTWIKLEKANSASDVLVILQYPSSGSVNKEVGVFSKGQVQLSASVDKKVCCPGKHVSLVFKAVREITMQAFIRPYKSFCNIIATQVRHNVSQV